MNAMNKFLFVLLGFAPLLAQATVTVPSGTTLNITTDAQVEDLRKDGNIVVESGGTLEFNCCSLKFNVGEPKLSGSGTVLFNFNGGATDFFRVQWDAMNFTGTMVITNNSAIETYSTKCFGKAKVVVYASTTHTTGTIHFISLGTGTYANDFELHGYGQYARPCLRADNSDVTISGTVIADGSAAAATISARSDVGKTKGQIRFAGNFRKPAGNCMVTMVSTSGDRQTEAGLPLAVFGNGTVDSVIDLGGEPAAGGTESKARGYLCMGADKGLAIIAGAVTNGAISLRNGGVWKLAIDDPFRHCAAAEAIFDWPNEANGGWVDLNGHHLRIGPWGSGLKYDNNNGNLTFESTATRKGGFCNTADRTATLEFRTLFGGMKDETPCRLEMSGNLTIDYDGVYAAYPAKEYDFDTSFGLWLGNFPSKSSSLNRDVVARVGAVHMASSANYPNVSKLVAKTQGAVYVHSGATLNDDLAICLEGNGRVYLQQDITVSYIAVDGQVVKSSGTYTTDDFDNIFSFKGANGKNPDLDGAPARTITVTGTVSPVAKVGNNLYATCNEAIAAANGSTVELLANATYTPLMDFKVRKGTFTLVPDGTEFSGYTEQSAADGVTTYVYRSQPTFSGGNVWSPSPIWSVTTQTDLRELAYWVGEGKSFAGESFRQDSDIAWDAAVDGAFAGIGTADSDSSCFAGTYDGAGHEISGMHFTDRKYAGLFNQVTNAVIENLTMNGLTFVGAADAFGGAPFVGNAIGGSRLIGLVAKGNVGTAENPLKHSAAGIVYRATDSSVLSCTNEATIVSSDSKVAGVLAITQNERGPGRVTIENCVNAGSIVQKGCATQEGGVGGILAYGSHWEKFGAGGIVFRNCINTGAVSSDFATCYLGSVLGCVYGDIPVECEGCAAQANMKSVGAQRPGLTCQGIAVATIDDGMAHFVDLSDGVTGQCDCRLMSDSNENVVFAEKTAKLTLDLSLGTDYSGMVTFNDRRVKGVLVDATHLVFWKGWGLCLIVR